MLSARIIHILLPKAKAKENQNSKQSTEKRWIWNYISDLLKIIQLQVVNRKAVNHLRELTVNTCTTLCLIFIWHTFTTCITSILCKLVAVFNTKKLLVLTLQNSRKKKNDDGKRLLQWNGECKWQMAIPQCILFYFSSLSFRKRIHIRTLLFVAKMVLIMLADIKICTYMDILYDSSSFSMILLFM